MQPTIPQFFDACTSGDIRTCEKILLSFPQYINLGFEHQHYNTPLMIASIYRQAPLLKRLLAKKTIDLTKTNLFGNTALMVAISYDAVDCVKLLLAKSHPTLINQRNHDGDTPLILAAKYGNQDIVTEVLKYKPNLHLINERGEDAWQAACQRCVDSTLKPTIRGLVDNFTHVFLSHEWGNEIFGHFVNHERVSRINDELQRRGLITWFNKDHMRGDAKASIYQGIRGTCCVIVFMTQRYYDLITHSFSTTDGQDDCQHEFKYAMKYLGRGKIIPVIIDVKMKNISNLRKNEEFRKAFGRISEVIDVSDVYLDYHEREFLSQGDTTMELISPSHSSSSSSLFRASSLSSFGEALSSNFNNFTVYSESNFQQKCNDLYNQIQSVLFS